MVRLPQVGATFSGAFFSSPRLPLDCVVQLRLSRVSIMWLTLLLLASASELYGSVPLFATQGALASSAESKCEETETETNCICGKEESKAKELQATLSAAKSTLQLLCRADLIYAPGQLSNKQVCPENISDLTQCRKCDGGAVQYIDVTSLLAGSTEAIKWEDSLEEQEGETAKRLSIPPANLPYSDKKFIVGCLDKEKTTTKCALTVSLEARPTVTENQTVTCAYGASSNEAHQTIKLSPSKNRFTLVCGRDGEVLPSEYEDVYCPSQEKGDAAAECTGNYTEVIPAYDSKWWEHDTYSNTFSLLIPESGFPAKETKLLIGCQKKSSQLADTARQGAAQASSTVCNVDITVEGVPSSTSLPQRVVGLLSWVMGFGTMLSAFGFA
ncbi:SAG-related sequence SRS38C [Toxoplasma gondii GAB2-2007-GAL-DOM2]|uniref:SAG-related sequence SRS38C n=6 Tax=Toxoplasma gondii TaxID=5811 RepID=S7VVI2_TOXGG|nr:SAG-related sequence SRS38C [Toxoplasma gondii GT1]KAF4644090.1 SAG-related sequence SRS38C [Toxoplasma gondii]KFG38844.1 SAG-related sequence SRS38C [Toxoplasma gondii GAB2-2007-GAL-DOM2]KFG43010.1 SAG-related sequence SRS38C [Toxoplasma gondii FOU]KYF45574.1 SAG-related sequence SRS38C [Toxoplasma gondii ARI]RQX74154.1 SAG-related sequence SRS38C [Toxoplasma gondii CAST]